MIYINCFVTLKMHRFVSLKCQGRHTAETVSKRCFKEDKKTSLESNKLELKNNINF